MSRSQKAPATSEQPQLHLLLPKSVLNELNLVILPAHQNGLEVQFVHAMSKLISKLDASQLTAMDGLAKAHQIELRKQYAILLAKAIEHDVPFSLPRLKIEGIEYLQGGIKAKINADLKQLSQHQVQRNPLELPKGWRDTENMFKEINAWTQRLKVNTSLAELGTSIQRKLLARAKAKDDQPMIQRLQPAIRLQEKTQQVYHDVLEREIELRVAELAKAEATLRNEQDFFNQFHAAMALELQGEALTSIFQQYSAEDFQRPALQDAALPERCEKLLASGRESGPELIAKAMALLSRDSLVATRALWQSPDGPGASQIAVRHRIERKHV